MNMQHLCASFRSQPQSDKKAARENLGRPFYYAEEYDAADHAGRGGGVALGVISSSETSLNYLQACQTARNAPETVLMAKAEEVVCLKLRALTEAFPRLQTHTSQGEIPVWNSMALQRISFHQIF